MAWHEHTVPNLLRWCGLFATFAGAGLALWAALSAKGAKKQAQEAKRAAIRLGRVLQLSDLIADMQEIQTMLARRDFESIASKSSNLRGRVVRFKHEAYNQLGAQEAADMDIARDQLAGICKVASLSKAQDETRIGKIQVALGHANEALNKVFAIHHADAHRE